MGCSTLPVKTRELKTKIYIYFKILVMCSILYMYSKLILHA